MPAGPRAHIHHVVGGPHRGFVVLDDQHRIPEVPELKESIQEAAVVPRMEADTRLVQHVQDADQAASDLSGQANALRLAARQRVGRPAQGQVPETHLGHEVQALAHFLEDRARNLLFERLAGATCLHALEQRESVVHGQLDDRREALTVHGHRPTLGPQPASLAIRAYPGRHVLVEVPANGVAVRFVVLPADQFERTLPLQVRVALEDRGLLIVREHAPRAVQVERVFFRERRQELSRPAARGDPPGQDDAFQDGNPRIPDRKLPVRLEAHSEAVARRTGAVWRVERELPGLELGNADSALGARVVLTEQMSLRGGVIRAGIRCVLQHFHGARGHAESRLDGLGHPGPFALPQDQPVHHDRDVVVQAAVQLGRLRQVDQVSVHPRPDKAFLKGLVEQVPKFSLPTANERRQDLDPRSIRPCNDTGGDLRGGLATHRPSTIRTVGRADPGPEKSEVVVDLGNGPDGAARVACGRTLLDRDRRRQAVDLIDVRFLHHAEELAGVRRKRLYVAPLPLRVDRVECQR